MIRPTSYSEAPLQKSIQATSSIDTENPHQAAHISNSCTTPRQLKSPPGILLILAETPQDKMETSLPAAGRQPWHTVIKQVSK